MKITVSCCGLLLLMVGFAFAQQQKGDRGACGFIIQSEPTQPVIAGPDDIVPLVYVVGQPDSHIEIVSVDLQGMSLSFSEKEYSTVYTIENCATYKVHNRSDRSVQAFDLELLASTGEGGSSNRVHSSSLLASGQSAEIKSCWGFLTAMVPKMPSSSGGPVNHLKLLVSVQSVDFGDCLYRPSQESRVVSVCFRW
jgi:hypothetical protein